MIKLAYWAFVSLDVAALLFFFVLGLAAAGSTKTSPLSVALVMLVLPGIPLAASVLLFLRSSTWLWRAIAFVLAAAPLIFVVASQAYNTATIRANSNASGDLTFFTAGPQRDLVEAIRRNDAAAVTALVPKTNVNATGLQDMTPLLAALRQLRSTPTQHDVLKVLLAAGADPNKGAQYELPLAMALQIDDQTGPAPVTMLLAAGADPNVKNSFGTPIFFAGAAGTSSPEVLTLLIKHGADLHATSTSGETILIYAATAGNWKVARFLLDQGADWKMGRSLKKLTFAEMVEESARKAHDSYDGNAKDDVGLQDVVNFLREKTRD
jgi:hypothetical protein